MYCSDNVGTSFMLHELVFLGFTGSLFRIRTRSLRIRIVAKFYNRQLIPGNDQNASPTNQKTAEVSSIGQVR